VSAPSEPTGGAGAGRDDALHRGLAEQGKLHAIDGQHELALAHYREAMRLSVEADAPEVFFRHYLECSMESLELMGANEDVVRYCHKVAEHYAGVEPADELQARFVALDLAANAQRLGANLLRLGRTDEAAEALVTAVDRARAAGAELPLAELAQGWLARRLTVDGARLEAEQRRLGYFAVTPESVDRSIAVPLPTEPMTGTR
jgi:tetratricopeptide (TPR) repeat protein